MKYSEFAEDTRARLSDFEDITMRRMFGGYGIFRRGIMFGLIADDRLFFKVDAVNKGDYQEAGMVPFVYDKHDMQGKKKLITMSYWEVPPHVVESEELFYRWAVKSYEAAVKNNKKETV